MTTSPRTGTWGLSGTHIESCNCDPASTGGFLGEPTQGDCTLLVGWHIEEGHAEGLELGGLNGALAVTSPSHLAQVPWTVALYLDERADGKQADALTRIFTGQLGGHPKRLASHIGKVRGITSTAIEFHTEGRRRSLRIGDVGTVEIEGNAGQEGNPVTVTGQRLCIAPGYPAEVARSTRLSYHDHGLDWELTGTSGLSSPFAYRA